MLTTPKLTSPLYNVHRWYAPGTGRYGRPDPVGLDALRRVEHFGKFPNIHYGYVDSNPLVAIDPNGLTVLVCEAPPEVPILQALGLPHKWIKTDTVEAGLGPRDGGVPGADGACDVDCPLAPTFINNHSGESIRIEGAVCRIISKVDEECVNKELSIGKPMGPWIPSINDCWTFVDNVIERCKKKGPRYCTAPVER